MIQPMSYGYPYGVKLDPKTLAEMQEKRDSMYLTTVQYIHIAIVQTKLNAIIDLAMLNINNSFTSVYLLMKLLCISS